MSKRKKSKKKKRILPIIVVLIIASLGAICLFLQDDKKSLNIVTKDSQDLEKRVKIVDINSKSRNIAVMFNNINVVWGYQAGLQEAYIVYEIIVEGGITRLMGIYKDASVDRIGTIRSSRPYYLDYVAENDAIYVHFGGSDQALSDIKRLGVNNINGMSYDSAFIRDYSLGLSSEHTVFTSTDKIESAINDYGYRDTTSEPLLLNYSVDPIDLSKKDGSTIANNVYIGYSTSRNTSFEYDNINKVYKRYQNGIEHKDYVTGNQYTAKNIITYKIRNYSLDSYGRQALDNIGSGDGYYITEGYAIPITWEKQNRLGKTIYRYLDGTEIKVNDGNTYIQIQPISQSLRIE